VTAPADPAGITHLILRHENSVTSTVTATVRASMIAEFADL